MSSDYDLLIPPERWGDDKLTCFFNHARYSAWATFSQEKYQNWVSSLIEIDAIFLNLIETLNDINPFVFEGLMLLSAHSAFRSCADLAMQGRTAETMGLNRNTLEYAIYAHFFFNNPKLIKVWSTREDSQANRKKVQQNFKCKKMIDVLIEANKSIGEQVKNLYEETIDLGAHPNEAALFRRLLLDKNPESNSVTMKLKYLQGGENSHIDTLSITVDIGITVLKCFSLIYHEQYNEKNLNIQIDKLSLLLESQKNSHI